MSDNEAKSPEKSQFTAKEEAILKVAWLCLKSGVPDIDMDRLKELGRFNTAKTASNTWGVIKKKLNAQGDGSAPPKIASDGDPVTPKSNRKKAARATPAKRPKVDDGGDDDGEVRTLGRKKARKAEGKIVEGEGAEKDSIDRDSEA